ncbi:MAG: hypothetical protein IKK10_06350 [Clostridia bacterium]|nr:hypothetical protein [Clostridia bacterium]
MFGYVYIHKPELKVKDYEAYRGVYCSLCKTLGKHYSVFARFILNYDCTFLSLLLLSRNDGCPGFKKGRCPFNPMKKCNYTFKADDALDKGAALTVITSYYKLLDSIADGGVLKKAGCTLIRPFFSSWHKKAERNFPEYETIVKEMFFSQLECEKSAEICLDMAADPTAKMLQNIMKLEAKNETEEKVFAQFGYHLGRWIYLMDAAADIDDDSKRGNFNPFLLKYGEKSKVDIEEVNGIISQSCYLLTKAYELIDKKRFTDILDNIIYNGLPVKQRNIIYPERKS